jgi:hypothetical protein
MPHSEAHPDLRKRVKHELESYLATAAFLTIFFAAFTTYRSLVLAEYHIGYLDYGWAVVQALILAKVILIGQAMHLGDWLHDRPLIVPVVGKTIIFGLLVGVFSIAEHGVKALLHHRSILQELSLTGPAGYEKLARVVLMTIAFLPFFAFWELGRVLGEGKLLEIFFRKPAARDLRG